MAHRWWRGGRVPRSERRAKVRAGTTIGDAVLHRHHEAVPAGVGHERRIERNDPGVPDRGVDVTGREQLGGLLGRGHHLADGHDAHVATLGDQTRGPSVTDRVGIDVTRRRLRPPQRGRTVVVGDRVAQHHAQLLVRRRCVYRHAGHLREQREVEETVMARAVVTGDTGAVDTQNDRYPVEPDVVDELVPGAVEERRVDRHDRPQPAESHPCGGGHGVLLRDSHVEAAVGVACRERQQPRRAGHPGRYGDDVGVVFRQLQERVREGVGVRGRDACGCDTRRAVERADVVQPLLVVVFGGRVAVPFLGDDVHDDGPRLCRRVGERSLQRGDVVTVDRTGVPEPE